MARSPFPGMDSFLEDHTVWTSVHTRLINVIGELLSRDVSDRYYVSSEENVTVLDPLDPSARLIRPDVHISESIRFASPPQAPTERDQASVGTIPTMIQAVPKEIIEYRSPYLVIEDVYDHSVVCIIEILSPINKTAHSRSQQDFDLKRERVIHSPSHWLEIDLVRYGERYLEWTRTCTYYAAVHRANSSDPYLFEVWPIGLRERLPRLPVPLRSPDPDVSLDLQEALDLVYDRFHYEKRINYTQTPPPPTFNEDDRKWIAETISTEQQFYER